MTIGDPACWRVQTDTFDHGTASATRTHWVGTLNEGISATNAVMRSTGTQIDTHTLRFDNYPLGKHRNHGRRLRTRTYAFQACDFQPR